MSIAYSTSYFYTHLLSSTSNKFNFLLLLVLPTDEQGDFHLNIMKFEVIAFAMAIY